MRKTRQTLCCVLLVVLLVCSLCVPAMAVDAASLVSLSGPAAAKTGEAVEILVNAETANVIADGRLVISYDPAVLEFTGAEVGTATFPVRAVFTDGFRDVGIFKSESVSASVLPQGTMTSPSEEDMTAPMAEEEPETVG